MLNVNSQTKIKGGDLKSKGQPCMKLGQTRSLTAASFITIKLSGITQKKKISQAKRWLYCDPPLHLITLLLTYKYSKVIKCFFFFMIVSNIQRLHNILLRAPAWCNILYLHVSWTVVSQQRCSGDITWCDELGSGFRRLVRGWKPGALSISVFFKSL